MAKWKRPKKFSTPTPSTALYSIKEATRSKKTAETPSRKEALLRKSLDLAEGERNNEGAIAEIVDKAIDGGLYGLAMEAMRAFSPDANHSLCWAIEYAFDLKNWRFFDEDFSDYCEQRLFKATECRAGMYMGGHQPDVRSCALGKLGLFYFLRGDEERAFTLWETATEVRDIDEIIADAAREIAREEPTLYEAALSLVDLITTKTKKAKALAQLSDYA